MKAVNNTKVKNDENSMLIVLPSKFLLTYIKIQGYP